MSRQQARAMLRKYQKDWHGFYTDILGVPAEHIWSKMHEINDSIRDNENTAVRAGHGVSKTFDIARMCLQFLCCHPPATVVTTAPTGKQVKDVLWREIRDAHTNAKFPLGGKLTTTMLDYQESTGLLWFATGFSTKPETVTAEATAFQGYHNQHLMIAFEEAAGIHPAIWRAAQHIGAPHRRFVAIGNATSKSGEFPACFKSPLYNKIVVSVKDTPNFIEGREVIPKIYGRAYEQAIRIRYGEDSDEYAVRVLGEISRKGSEGSYYGRILADMAARDRIGRLDHDPNYDVYVAWDIGYTTAIWLFQLVGNNVHFIKYYEDSGPGIPDYVRLLTEWGKEGNYHWGFDIVPCDMDSNSTRIITGNTALDELRALGRKVVALKVERRVIEGIERTKRFLRRCLFSREGCPKGLERLENYHEGKNVQMSTEDESVFTGVPAKDGNDHGADAMRYASKAVEEMHLGSGMTAQEDRELFAKYGG